MVTPTEAALIGVIYSALVGMFIYKTLSLKDLIPACIETVKTTAANVDCALQQQLLFHEFFRCFRHQR